jgi:site-specific DNA recombinase
LRITVKTLYTRKKVCNKLPRRYSCVHNRNEGGGNQLNVIGYIRVSTHGQVKDGYGLSVQEDEIIEYCRKEGWNLLHIFRDEGISGAIADEVSMEVDREGFQDMLAFIQNTKVDRVVVLNTNRLWRGDLVKVLIHREFKKSAIDIRSIEQPSYSIYKIDPSDFLINRLMELLDMYQRLEIIMKLGKGKRKKAMQGEYVGGKVTYGYTIQPGQDVMQLNEQEAQVIRIVFEWKREYPNWSLSQLAEALNERGYRTRLGFLFSKVHVKRILDRKAVYEGMYQYASMTGLGKHRPVLGQTSTG